MPSMNFDDGWPERIEQLLQKLLSGTHRPHYTVEQFAALVGRKPFTVRQWCNLGRVNAQHSMTQTGLSNRWVISHEEYNRFLREGLLPVPRPEGDGPEPGRIAAKLPRR